MSGILRKTAQIFGASLNPANNLAIWGSLLSGSVAYSNDPAAIQSAAWLNGLAGALVGNKSPTEQDLNGLFYVLAYQIAYLLERGLSEYDPNTTYNQFDVCRVGAKWYSSVVNNNLGNVPPSAQWTDAIGASGSPAMALAWVLFSGIGGGCTVFNGYNVSGVAKLATGSYQVSFANPLPSSNYGLFGSCGAMNGQVADGGSNDLVIGAPNGVIGVKSQSQCNVYTREPTQSPGLEDCGCIFVGFFGS